MPTLTESKKAVRLPRGTAIWPKLNEADTKFDKAGVYETRLAFDADTPGLADLMAKVEAMIEAEYQAQFDALEGKAALQKKLQKADSPFKVEEDEENGEETGRIVVKVKMKASGISAKTGKPWKNKPDIFDAKGNKLVRAPAIGGGSVLIANVDLVPYFAANDKSAGVSLRLNAVQVIKLVQFGSRDAGGYGFGEEEGDDLSNMGGNDLDDESGDNSADDGGDDGL